MTVPLVLVPGLVVGLLVALASLWPCPAALPGSGLLAVGFASPPSCFLSSFPGVFSLAGSLAPASLLSPRALWCFGMDFWRPSTDFVGCLFRLLFWRNLLQSDLHGLFGILRVTVMSSCFQVFTSFDFSFDGESGSENLVTRPFNSVSHPCFAKVDSIPMPMQRSEADIVREVALMSMLLRFMEFDLDSSSDKIARVEEIVALFQAILQFLGTAPSLESIHLIWKSAILALIEMEAHFFPGYPIQTSNALVAPAKWLPFSRLATQEWERFRPLLLPGYYALKYLNDWLWTEYAVEVHEDLFHTFSDALLLVEATLEMCKIPLDPTATVVLETY